MREVERVLEPPSVVADVEGGVDCEIAGRFLLVNYTKEQWQSTRAVPNSRFSAQYSVITDVSAASFNAHTVGASKV